MDHSRGPKAQPVAAAPETQGGEVQGLRDGIRKPTRVGLLAGFLRLDGCGSKTMYQSGTLGK